MRRAHEVSMPDDLQSTLVAALLLWSLVSLASAMAGLYARPGDFWRSFWFMSGLWGLIDGLIAWYGLVGPAQAADRLMQILRLNSGIDVLYVIAGAYMMTRAKPRIRGFGLAVVLQGLFLLGFDGYFWWRFARVVG